MRTSFSTELLWLLVGLLGCSAVQQPSGTRTMVPGPTQPIVGTIPDSTSAKDHASPAVPPVAAAPSPIPNESPVEPGECSSGIGQLASEKPTGRELKASALALIDCWVAALNARHASSLARTYRPAIEYDWSLVRANDVIEEQLRDLRERATQYAEHRANLSVDEFGTVHAQVTLISSGFEKTVVLAHICNFDRQLRICVLNDKEKHDRNAQCAAAVRKALFSIPQIRKSQRGSPRFRGLETPLRDGEFDMVLIQDGPGYVQLPYQASVNSGHLSIHNFDLGELPIAPVMRDAVRKACVPFEEDCVAACTALGQCVRLHGTCVAQTDEQCESSEVCKAFGNCHAGGTFGQCIAKSEADCKQSKCAERACALGDDTCLIRTWKAKRRE